MLIARFAKVRADPGASRARADAITVLAGLETAEAPKADEIALVVDDAFVWVGLGLARRARVLVERWRRAGLRAPGLSRAEAIYTVAIAPPAAAGRLRSLAGDPVAAAAAIANHVFRGELRAAVDRCVAERWFLDHPAAINGVVYGVWAQAMLEDFDGALAVIATWRHRHAQLDPEADQALLATEARIESMRHHHARERALLEEAIAICDDAGLGLPRAYLEASLAIALARAGELDAAHKLARKWPARGGGEQALAVYRDVARAELALLDGEFREADAAARRVLAYAEAAGNAIYGTLARFHRVLAATRATVTDLLDDYGRLAAQLQIPLHLRRHRLLAAAGGAPRDKRLTIRTRRGKQTAPVVRLFYPALADLGADLCWDRVQALLYLGGDGPFSLGEHPILRRVLEAILAAPGFALPIGDLFQAVWDMPYDPIRHEGKCHVALHRLRALLGGWRAGADRLIAVRDGAVRIADDATACVIELAAGVPEEPDAASRVVAFVAASGSASPAEICKRVGVSRSALQLVLRALVADGRLHRDGGGRSIRYRT